MSSSFVHMVNHGLTTAQKGLEIESFIMVIGATGAVGTIEQGKSNFIDNIQRVSAGLYTVQMTLAYPPAHTVIVPALSIVAANDTFLRVNYVVGSYSPTAGTFQLQITTSGGAAADGVNGSSLHCIIFARRYTTE